MQTQTVVDQIEIIAGGNIGVRLVKQFVQDGAVVGFPDQKYHRTLVEAGTPDAILAEGITANVNHLAAMGFPLDDAEGLLAKIKAHAALEWTPAQRSAFVERLRNRAEAERKSQEEARASEEAAKSSRNSEIADAVAAELTRRGIK